KKTGSVKAYTGACYADFLPLDIDSEDLSESDETARRILMNLQDKYGLDLKTLRVSFSGAKGFHIEIPAGIFGFQPSPILPKILKAMAEKIIPDGVTIDTAIYGKSRLWRLPNTVNSKSGLYKIRLTAAEVFNLRVDEIRELAKQPRKGVFYDPNVELNPALNKLYMECKAEVGTSLNGGLSNKSKQIGDKKYKAFLRNGVGEAGGMQL
ncbi:MAG: hypothetical protein ACHQ6U_13625, partial [Thermodesulfobacteriota bacterium]